jgi:6,7-dimethyl-8-ribityllumazine synthase
MLKAIRKTRSTAKGMSFAIVASRYNAKYVDSMVHEAEAELRRSKAKGVRIVRVPGAYEVPIVAARLARQAADKELIVAGHTDTPDAIICLGVILRGETTHAAHIGDAVSRALMELQLRYEIPVIHEVLLLENHEQAKVRCLDPEHNRGREAAQTAVAMASLMRSL